MDHATFHVVYLDGRARFDRYETGGGGGVSGRMASDSGHAHHISKSQPSDVRSSLDSLLGFFQGVHVCTTGVSCMASIRELESIRTDCTPTLVFVDVLTDPEGRNRSKAVTLPGNAAPLPPLSAADRTSKPDPTPLDPEHFYGISVLKHIATEIHVGNLSKLIVPIAMCRHPEQPVSLDVLANNHGATRRSEEHALASRGSERSLPVDARRMAYCLEKGAVDVVRNPIAVDRLETLLVHGYRAHIEGRRQQPAALEMYRRRKRSWVGVEEEKPYSYLRESMVSTLMNGICNPDSIPSAFQSRKMDTLDDSRRAVIATAIGSWDFSAHEFSEDELVHAAFLMLEHALQMPELERWRLPADGLRAFLMACRAAYNDFVPYHNFRHVIDVLQAVFFFLLQLGTIPPYPFGSTPRASFLRPSPVAALLQPFDALTLLISAIGHDVGHPGVNNAFLVALKAPLAQLYNDSSVLEAFHCAAYSQILRRYWTVAFEDTDLRRLLIKSILATDMQVHFKYMTDLGNLQEKLHHNKGTDGWSPQLLEEYKTLACGLLIKCADISNVARPFGIAARWSDILQLEFARQGEMEKDVGIPTTLFGGPPELGNATKLANSQIGFMNIFAYPLFEGVTDILPGMRFAVDEIKANQTIWMGKIEEEKSKDERQFERRRYTSEGRQSPRSGSPDRVFGARLSHPEGLPASDSSPEFPSTAPLNASRGTPPPRPDSPSTGANSSRRHRMSTPWQVDHSRPSSTGPRRDSMSSDQGVVQASRGSSDAYPPSSMPSAPLTWRSGTAGPAPLQLNFGSGMNASAPNIFESRHLPPRPSGATPEAGSNGNALLHRDTASNGIIRPTTEPNGSNSRRTAQIDDYASSFSTAAANPLPGCPTNLYQHPSHQSTHHSLVGGRYSGLSAHDRFSTNTSGAPTFASANHPASPTDTQATSFLTDGSSVGHSSHGRSSVPEMPEHQRSPTGNSATFLSYQQHASRYGPVAAARYSGMGMGMGMAEAKVPVSILKGHVGVGEERKVRRKGSRFRFVDFWKKRKDGMSP